MASTAPGIRITEVPPASRPILGVSTSTCAMLGVAERGPIGRPVLVTSFDAFVRRFGGPLPSSQGRAQHPLYYSARHFFAQGGTTAWVVRTAGYTDPGDPSTLQATAASRSGFAGRAQTPTAPTLPTQATDPSEPVSNALTVTALEEGSWGRRVQVRTRDAILFSTGLSEPVAGTTVKQVSLSPGADVQVGTVLWLVQEASGVATSVSGNQVEFGDGITPASATANTGIASGTMVYSPDLAFQSELTAALTDPGTPGDPHVATLASASELRIGSIVNFAVADKILVVTRVSEKQVAGQSVPVAHVADATVSAGVFTTTATRVYGRGFDLDVRYPGTAGEVVETIPGLSPVAGDLRNGVGVRLHPQTGESRHVTATGTNAAALVDPTGAFVDLDTGGSDGLDNATGQLRNGFLGSAAAKTGLRAFDDITDASILIVPWDGVLAASGTHMSDVTNTTIAYCEQRQSMFYIVDPPPIGADEDVGDYIDTSLSSFRGGRTSSSYAGLYAPWLIIDEVGVARRIGAPPSGAIAGVFSRNDRLVGVHHAPAGLRTARIDVAQDLAVRFSKADADVLYPERINPIRPLVEGTVVWGTRTLSADTSWIGVSVRRLFIFLEQSLVRGLAWTPFEPADLTLYKSIERSVAAFLRLQWIEGKLLGATEDQAFRVRCSAENNPPEVVAAGEVVVEIAAAPVRPAEFVIFRFRLSVGSVDD